MNEDNFISQMLKDGRVSPEMGETIDVVLDSACIMGHVETVRILAKVVAETNIRQLSKPILALLGKGKPNHAQEKCVDAILDCVEEHSVSPSSEKMEGISKFYQLVFQHLFDLQMYSRLERCSKNSDEGAATLLQAIIKNNETAVSILVSHPINVEKLGLTVSPLEMAVDMSSDKICLDLLKICSPDANVGRALVVAAERERTTILEPLLEQTNVFFAPNALLNAARKGKKKSVEMFVDFLDPEIIESTVKLAKESQASDFGEAASLITSILQAKKLMNTHYNENQPNRKNRQTL